MNQSEIEANTSNTSTSNVKRGKTRANKLWLVLVLCLIGWERGARFFHQSGSTLKQNQSKRKITFDTELKTALKVN